MSSVLWTADRFNLIAAALVLFQCQMLFICQHRARGSLSSKAYKELEDFHGYRDIGSNRRGVQGDATVHKLHYVKRSLIAVLSEIYRSAL